jgi:hypothetical protein
MAMGPVVLYFDVLEEGLAKSVVVHQHHTVDALDDLQAVGEAPYHCIVVAVPSAAHAGGKAIVTNQVAMIPATVNAAVTRAHDHAARLATQGKTTAMSTVDTKDDSTYMCEARKAT